MNLARMEQLKMEKHYELQEIRWAYEKRMKELESEIADLNKQKGLLLAEMDENKVQIAEGTLRFTYGFARMESRTIQKAIEDIVKGCVELKDSYFGIKDYDRWKGQESNHPYGYGPKHGHIVFSIGLKNPKNSLNDEEQEACLYFLYQLLENASFLKVLLKREEDRQKLRVI